MERHLENSLLAPLSTDPLRMWTHRHSSTDIWHQGRMSVDEIIKASLTCRLLFGQSSLTPKKQLTFSAAAGPTKKEMSKNASQSCAVGFWSKTDGCLDHISTQCVAVIQQVCHGPVIWHCGTGATGLMKRRCNVQHQDSSTRPGPKSPFFSIQTANISTLCCK